MDTSDVTVEPSTVESNLHATDNEEILLSGSDDEVTPQEENKQPPEELPSILEPGRPQTSQTEGKYRIVRNMVKDYANTMYQRKQAVVEKRWKKYDKVKEIQLKREEGDLPVYWKIARLNKKLAEWGFEYSNEEGNCCRAAIYKGIYKVEKEEDLDQVILEDKMPEYICNHKVTVKLRDVLNQIDYAGTDYEDGQSSASVFCDKYSEDDTKDGETCSEGRIYVTNICSGKPRLDCGKFHNHCTDCKNFGKCIYDYRNTHCWKCGHHYFGGFIHSFPCNFCAEPKKWKSKDMIDSLTRLMVLCAGIPKEEMPDVFSDYGDIAESDDEWGI